VLALTADKKQIDEQLKLTMDALRTTEVQAEEAQQLRCECTELHAKCEHLVSGCAQAQQRLMGAQRIDLRAIEKEKKLSDGRLQFTIETLKVLEAHDAESTKLQQEYVQLQYKCHSMVSF
jgi:hypothetical protein